MSQVHYDVIVVGGGAVGLATGAALAKTDKKALVLEQYAFFNQKGSSAGMSRQFRVQYAQDYMAQLALDSIPYWDALQKTTPETLIDKVGSLWFGDPAVDSQEGGIHAAIEVMEQLHIPYEAMTAAQIEARFPFKDIPEDYTGFFQKDGGIIDLHATMKALYEVCRQAENIDLLEWAKVEDLQSFPGQTITVCTALGDFTADKLVITPGAYVNDVLDHFGLAMDIDIWEMSSAYYRKTADIKLPTWFVFQEHPLTNLFYGFPEVAWSHSGYIRVAPDIPDRILQDPSRRTGVPSQRSLALNAKWVQDHMEGLDSTSEFTATCLITLSENGKELLLDHLPTSVPNNDDIWVYTGGWAAKFIPLLGHIMADLALTGKSPYDLSPFQIKFRSIR